MPVDRGDLHQRQRFSRLGALGGWKVSERRRRPAPKTSCTSASAAARGGELLAYRGGDGGEEVFVGDQPSSTPVTPIGGEPKIKLLKLPAIRREYQQLARQAGADGWTSRTTYGNCSTARSAPAQPAPPRTGCAKRAFPT